MSRNKKLHTIINLVIGSFIVTQANGCSKAEPIECSYSGEDLIRAGASFSPNGPAPNEPFSTQSFIIQNSQPLDLGFITSSAFEADCSDNKYSNLPVVGDKYKMNCLNAKHDKPVAIALHMGSKIIFCDQVISRGGIFPIFELSSTPTTKIWRNTYKLGEAASSGSVVCTRGPLAEQANKDGYYDEKVVTPITPSSECPEVPAPKTATPTPGTSSGMPPGTSPSDLPPVDPTGTGSGTSTSSGGDNQKYQDGQGGAGGMGGDGGAGGGFFMGYYPAPSAPNPISPFAQPLEHRVATM